MQKLTVLNLMALILVCLTCILVLTKLMMVLKNLPIKWLLTDLKIGSLVAPIWPPDGGSAMGSAKKENVLLNRCASLAMLPNYFRELGIRPYGVVRIDSAINPETWITDPVNNTDLIAETFREACDVAADYGESWLLKAKSAGAACIAGRK